MHQNLTGQILLDHFLIEEFITSGPLWAVYRAWDTQQSAPLLLKVLYPELKQASGKVALINTCVQDVNRLKHPAILTGYSFNTASEMMFIARPYINGPSLRHILTQRGSEKLPLANALTLFKVLSSALDDAHACSCIHGHLTPENILVDEQGQIFVTDWGLNGLLTAAPASEITPAVDRYALDSLLCELIDGETPQPTDHDQSATEQFQAACDAHGILAQDIPDRLPVDLIQANGQIVTPNHQKHALQTSPLAGTRSHSESTLTLVSPSSAEPVPVITLPPARASRAIRTPAALLGGISLLALCLFGAFFIFLTTSRVQQVAVQSTAIVQAQQQSATALSVFTATPTLTPTIPTTTAIAAAPTITPSITPTAIGGGQGWVAFASVRSEYAQVYLMDPDGNNIHPVTTLDGGACQPDWSPDGKQIVFISPCSGASPQDSYQDSNLFILDLENNQVTPLKLNVAGGNFDPAWSPDGTRIAFVSVGRVATDNMPHLYIYDLKKKSFSGILTNISARAPSWSPDNNHLAFEVPAAQQVWIVTSDASHTAKTFSSKDFFAYSPAWSPDGKIILFGQQRAPMLVYKGADESYGAETVIDATITTRPAWDEDFSKDSRWIMYTGGENQIYRFLLSGDQWDLKPITNGFHPAWQH